MNRAITKYSPDDFMRHFGFWDNIEDMFALSRLYNSIEERNANSLPVNISEDETSITFEVLTHSEPEVFVKDNTLEIKLLTEKESEQNKKKFLRREFVRSEVSRSFRLPKSVQDVTPDTLQASYKDGILRVKIYKQNVEPKSFKVQVASDEHVLTNGSVSVVGLENNSNAQTSTLREREGE